MAKKTSLVILNYQGQDRLLALGESLEGYQLIAVTGESATLRKGDQEFQLGLSEPFQTQPEEELEPELTTLPSQEELRSLIDHPGGSRLKSVERDGTIVGMRLSFKKGHPFHRMGLRDGDIILAVNEIPATGPESLSQIYRVVRNSQTLSFRLERAGLKMIHQIELP